MKMKFEKKYSHIGNAWVSVPKGWVSIVENALIEIEKLMWPQWWIPMWTKRVITKMATGGSVVRIKFWWAYHLREKLTKGCIVQDIKEKYASLRIYGSFTKEMRQIIQRAEKECHETCQDCESKKNVECVNDHGWYTMLCENCRDHPRFSPTREVLIEKY